MHHPHARPVWKEMQNSSMTSHVQHSIDIIIAARDAFKRPTIVDMPAVSPSPTLHQQGLQPHGLYQHLSQHTAAAAILSTRMDTPMTALTASNGKNCIHMLFELMVKLMV
jgi:hypothetical protein